MAFLNRTVSGLLLRDDFSSANGAAGASYSRVSDPTRVAFDRHPTPIISTSGAGIDFQGCRDAQWFMEPGQPWRIIYVSGTGASGWEQILAESSDRGQTWSKSQLPMHKQKTGTPADGNYGGIGVGWIEKRGGTYYEHRGTAAGHSGGVLTSPYYGDLWTTTDWINWTFVLSYGPLTVWATANAYPGSVYLDGSTYRLFIGGDTDNINRSVGYQTSTSPSGAFTLNTTPQVTGALWDAQGRTVENPKVIYDSWINRYLMLVNLVDPSNSFADRNGIVLSSSVSDWSGAKAYYIQDYMRPCDSNYSPIGMATPIMSAEGIPVIDGATGFMPTLFDADPTDANHIGRKLFTNVLEPALYRLHFSGTTRESYPWTLSHTDVHAEFEVDFAALATGADVSFEYRSNGTAGYRMRIRADAAGPRLQLQKMDGTIIFSNTTNLTIIPGLMHRIRVSCVGTSHKAYLDGELDINVTDSTYSSGSQVALSATNCTADIRLFHARTSDTITVRGLAAAQSITIRAAGGLPVASVTANGSGIATFAYGHWPLSMVSGTVDAQTTDFLLWGGDDVTLTGYTPPKPGTSASGIPVFASGQ
jgi:hypothetical protein